MGRGTNRADPLRPRASRVEKTRVSRRTAFPSWYYRVLSLRWDHHERPFEDEDPHDFNDDLLELEEESKGEEITKQPKKEAEPCECGGEDSKYDYQFSNDDDTEDDESERSYDGSDADYYYDLKEQRKERKHEKLEERKKKDQRLECEKSKEEEICTVYKSLRKAEKKHKTIPIRPLAGEEFLLFYSDHINHFYNNDFNATKWVYFFKADGTDINNTNLNTTNAKESKSGDKTGLLYRVLDLTSGARYQFGPFHPPAHMSWKPVKVKDSDGEHELSFQFISHEYLKLRVSRDMVFVDSDDTHHEGVPTTAPAYFDFAGIWRDPEKDKAERQRRERERESRRPPSPRESWFEMNHPMGAWACMRR